MVKVKGNGVDKLADEYIRQETLRCENEKKTQLRNTVEALKRTWQVSLNEGEE